MTNCLDIRVLLLEAEPEQLAGEGRSPVAQHVRSCEVCGALAGTILEETAALDRFLAQGPSAPNVDAILSGAAAPGGGSGAESNVVPFPAWRRWAALAAAAAVAGMFFVRGDAPMQITNVTVFEGAPLVEASPDQNVAVLATANPDITVLWFF